MICAALKRLAQKVLAPLNLAVVTRQGLQALHGAADAAQRPAQDLALLRALAPAAVSPALHALPKSTAQNRQDIFALAELGFKRDGFFVDFGATNGVDLSNSFLLERDYGWSGVLAEQARCWHEALHRNRACVVDTRCVWRASGETLTFHEADIAELSTNGAYRDCDGNKDLRKRAAEYAVTTVSLNDLLDQHKAPAVIDYLSIDTEASEYEILSAFDFSRRQFRVISYEHSFTPMREKIFALLTAHGYVRKLTEFSRWDDWYVKPGITSPLA
jgi:FkbM family methyltransferase